MNKLSTLLAASIAMTALTPLAPAAQHPKKHHKLATIAAGVGAYELAKHSHSKFLRKHRFAAGVAGAVAANHYLKKKDKHAGH